MSKTLKEIGLEIINRPEDFFEEIQIDEIPSHQNVDVLVPIAMSRCDHSKACAYIWDAFEYVLKKMSEKKYDTERKMRTSMNVMLYNYLRKNGMEIRRQQ